MACAGRGAATGKVGTNVEGRPFNAISNQTICAPAGIRPIQTVPCSKPARTLPLRDPVTCPDHIITLLHSRLDAIPQRDMLAAMITGREPWFALRAGLKEQIPAGHEGLLGFRN